MRTVAAQIVGLVALAGTGLALSATLGVTLGPTGPQPAALTVRWGDGVSFANRDSEAHTVTIPRVTVASPALAPGASWTYVFDGRSGNYQFRQLGTRNFNGNVVVQVTGRVTLSAGPSPSLGYGALLRLRGTSAYSGTPVLVEQRGFGATSDWTEVATVRASDAGAFSAQVRPRIGARYRASAAAGQVRSPSVTVRLRPQIAVGAAPAQPRKGRPVVVRARITPVGAAGSAELLRYDVNRRLWFLVDTRKISRGVVQFRWTPVPGTTRLRVSLRRGDLRAGFDPSLSRSLRVR
jgi:plastocyanin